MITRRRVLQAAVAQGIAGGCSSAMAQVTRRKGKGAAKRFPAHSPPVVADERVNDLLAPVRDEHHLPGLIGAILVGDQVAAIGAVGIRKIGSPEPIQVTDQVHLGSCTKAMTATLAGMLVDEKKLSWGSTVREVFPDQAEQVHPDFQAVTLSQLLTHRAGLPHDAAWRALHGQTPTERRLSLLTSMLSQPPHHRPGTTYEYSNVGYALAGLMAETVTGQSWEELMRERIFGPLGMPSAGFGPPGRPGTVEQPWGHRSVRGKVEPTQRDNPPVMGPAGTVHCSIPDWARFAALHLAGARGKPRLLKTATFRALHTPPAGREYAGGWLVCERTWANGRALTHGGSNTTWFSVVWLAPALNAGFLVSTNQGDSKAQEAADQAVIALIQAKEFLLGPGTQQP